LNSVVNNRRLRLAMTPLLPHFRAIWGVYQTGAGLHLVHVDLTRSNLLSLVVSHILCVLPASVRELS
jgi:hypothetical protein